MQSNHTSVRSRWGEKPYYSLDYYLKETFGQKVYKIALDAGMTCPNRDGTLDTRGCIFCSEGGSGDFATTNRSITAAIDAAICRLNDSAKETGQKYIAYGFKDERVKGLAELEYSFKKKKEYANEFPIHSLKLHYESDVNQYGQNYLYTSKDNVFLALKREKDDRIGYFKQAEMTYTNEFYSGFSFQLTARRRTDESSYLIPFLRKEGDVYTPVKDFSTSAAELKLRYAPNEKFFQTQWNRFPVSLDAPVFTLSHTIAGKGILGSDYTYNHTEAGIQKRFWFSAFGYTDIILKAGKVWNKVPFPLLIMPNANLSYTIQP